MSIRVIAGIAKGRKLKLVPGDSTRPVMDRVKEALFSILGRNVFDANVLDLFSGTGSIAIEALSRGAKHALCLDLDKRAIDTIKDNLQLTNLANKATVQRADAFGLLQSSVTQTFDLIYIAPPQYKSMWLKALQLLDEHLGWLADEGIIIVQIDPTEKEPFTLEHLAVYDERRYGNTLLLFLHRSEPTETHDTQQE